MTHALTLFAVTSTWPRTRWSCWTSRSTGATFTIEKLRRALRLRLRSPGGTAPRRRAGSAYGYPASLNVSYGRDLVHGVRARRLSIGSMKTSGWTRREVPRRCRWQTDGTVAAVGAASAAGGGCGRSRWRGLTVTASAVFALMRLTGTASGVSRRTRRRRARCCSARSSRRRFDLEDQLKTLSGRLLLIRFPTFSKTLSS